MSCPNCGGFVRRSKSKRFSFEDEDHEIKRMQCIECKGVFYLSENAYYPSNIQDK